MILAPSSSLLLLRPAAASAPDEPVQNGLVTFWDPRQAYYSGALSSYSIPNTLGVSGYDLRGQGSQTGGSCLTDPKWVRDDSNRTLRTNACTYAYMDFADRTWLPNTGSRTFQFVFKRGAQTQNPSGSHAWIDSANTWRQYSKYGATSNIGSNTPDGSFGAGFPFDGAFHVWTIVMEVGVNQRAYQDRATLIGSKSYNNASTGSGAITMFNANFRDANWALQARVGIGMYYNRVLSVAEIEQNYDYLHTIYPELP